MSFGRGLIRLPRSVGCTSSVFRHFHMEQARAKKNSWVNPRSKFSPRSQLQKTSKDPVIIEEEPRRSREAEIISDFKHYLKTTEIPKNLRAGILKTKLSAFVESNFHGDAVPTLNAVFMHLYRNNGNHIDVLSIQELFVLFRKSAQLILSSGSDVPEYMAILAQQFLKYDGEIPSEICILIVELGTSMKFSDFNRALRAVIKERGTKLPPQFTKELLDHLESQKKLKLSIFEDFLAVAAQEQDAFFIHDDFVKHFIDYVETLFAESNPAVHEYKNSEKNVYRIQIVSGDILEEASLDKLSGQILLLMVKFISDLNTVVANKNLDQQIHDILEVLEVDQIAAVLFKQDLFDESLAEALLIELSKRRDFEEIKVKLPDFIVSDDVKFSPTLRLQAALLKEYVTSSLESEVFERTKSVYDKLLETQDSEPENFYNKIVQSAMLAGAVSPRGEFMELLTSDFPSVELSVYSFQHRIDRAIALNDHVLAANLFEDSLLHRSVHWNHATDPSISLTLSNLIFLVSRKMNNIVDIFPFFRKIKSHMTAQCSAEAIHALATRMLEAECVGDTIEMLKRELPKIAKESPQKLPVTPRYAYAYRALLDLLHEFVITYQNEETHETNWVLYGELHKYFHVPYDTYMPAMEFFCKQDRLNAALVIFRQVKMLNELHGSHHNLPPLRDMYMFLLRTFGDQLYEEGVIEIHEYLKMDVSLPSQDIQLQNCVLSAYSNLQNVGKARDLFLSMSSNAKQLGGVNEETVQIMIKTYTYSDMLYVKKFWNNLSQFGVFPNYAIFKQYVIAHVYHGFVEDAIKLTEEIDDYHLVFSSDLLLAMHNYCLDTKKQKEVAKWAVENHKAEWESLKLSGLLKLATGYMPDTNLLTAPKK